MGQISEKIGLIQAIRRVSIIIYVISVICFSIISIFDRVSYLKKETEKIRNSYTEDQKLIIKAQVQTAVQLIQISKDSEISKDSILNSLSKIRFGSDLDGYIFVNTYDGIPLLFDAERVVEGKSIWELTDPNGVKVIQEERHAVLNPEGDFIYYSWLKLSTDSISPKVSFIKGIPDLKWMVGAGVYLDSIEEEIIALQKKILLETREKAILILVIFTMLLIIFQLIFRYFTKSVENEINLFSSYFDYATVNSEEINISNIRYKEFSHIAEDMNKMVRGKQEADFLRSTSERRLQLQREQSPLAYIEYDLAYNIIYWNASAERIFGYKMEEVLGKNHKIIIPPEEQKSIHKLFKNMQNNFVDTDDTGVKSINENITSNGKRITCEWYNKILSDKDGTIYGAISLADDITERKMMEDSLAKSLEEKQILLKEVHHRVKNNMAIISSFISLQSMNIQDESVLALLQSTDNRVKSMALIHEYLYKSANLKDINVKKYIDELVSILLSSYEFNEQEIITKQDIEQFELNLDLLIPLGMIINEIISNALKHAFVNIETPELIIKLVRSNPEEFVLSINDNGVGLPPESEIVKNDSIGFLLIQSLVSQLNGTLEISRINGTEYLLTVPI
jgi:PAS domain S-box-containing protein